MFEIINDIDKEVEEIDFLNDYVSYIVKKLELEKCEFNIIIVDNEKIHKINKEYRNVDRETDVISFAFEEVQDIKYDDIRFLGEIYICYDRCKEQAIEYGHSIERELCYLCVHGLLHLLGYDHMNEEDKKVMRTLEEEILSEYDIKR